MKDMYFHINDSLFEHFNRISRTIDMKGLDPHCVTSSLLSLRTSINNVINGVGDEMGFLFPIFTEPLIIEL